MKQANTTKMKCKCARIFPPEKTVVMQINFFERNSKQKLFYIC